MSVTSERLSLRASSVRDCVRKAVYEATGAPGRERSPREERFLYRGKSIGRDYTIFLASSNGWKILVDSGPDYWVPPELAGVPRNLMLPGHTPEPYIIAEKRVKWGYGTGHADAYIEKTRTIVECLSSAHASDEMVRSKLLQAVLYTEHDEQATNCRLVVIDPSDFSEEQIVVDPKSRQYKALVEEMLERLALLDHWADDNVLPLRVCRKPSDAIGHFCQHAEHCFEGWEPDPVEEIECDETLVDTLGRFDTAKKQLAEIRKTEKVWEAAQKDAQEILERLDLPIGTRRLGPFEVTRTFTQRKPTLDWERAEMAGALEPEMLGEYFKPGASFSTFKTVLVGDAPAEDFGDVPF